MYSAMQFGHGTSYRSPHYCRLKPCSRAFRTSRNMRYFLVEANCARQLCSYVQEILTGSPWTLNSVGTLGERFTAFVKALSFAFVHCGKDGTEFVLQ